MSERTTKTQRNERKDVVMRKKAVGALASCALAAATLTGCQSNDSGSGSRMLAKQPAYVNPPMNNYASTMPGNKSLGISDTNNRTGMSTPSGGIQQTGSAQVATPGSATQSSISTANALNMTSAGSTFDQGGQVISKPMGNSMNSSPASGPVPPSAPGGYTIPTPSAYTPPASPTVPTRKPGDDL
jgi:hypothetical protein